MRQTQVSSLTLGFAIGLFALMGSVKANDLQPGQKAQIYILLDFDGNPNFPSITWQHQTRGLAPFFGAALGLPLYELESLKERIIELVNEDYLEFDNIHFVTETDGLDFWYTLGIDDKTYVYSGDPDIHDDDWPENYSPIYRNQPCPETGEFFCKRLYGKAGVYADINEEDQFGGSIYQPLFARIFAGSFSIPLGGASTSEPPLIYGDSYLPIGLPDIDVENLAQALANGAAHEIAHLFRVVHPPDPCIGVECVNELMIADKELWMARHNKLFRYPDVLECLRKTLTNASTADYLEPNNDEAAPVTIESQQYTLTLHDPFDKDFFTYTAPPTTDHPLSFTITHDFPVEDQGLRRLIAVEVRKDGLFLPIEPISAGWQITDEDAGPDDIYTITVQQHHKRLPVKYRLQIGAGEDIYEAGGGNNTQATATLWPSSVVCDYSGLSIGNSTDVDYYSFNSLGGTVEVELSYDPTFGDLDLSIDGVNETELISFGAARHGRSLEQYTALLIYDMDRDVTWLRQAGYSGRITYDEALDLMNASNSSHLLGGSNWRLPRQDIQDDCLEGFNCTGGELGHLFYEELDNVGAPPPLGGLTNRGPFNDFDADLFWYETIDPVYGEPYVFNFFNGYQTTMNRGSNAYAWLVHDGNLMPLEGPRSRHKRMVKCGNENSIIRVSGLPMLYTLCIRKVSAIEGCPEYVQWIPFSGSGTFEYRIENPYSPGISTVTGIMQRGMYARILSQDASQVEWQIASWIDYGNDMGQPLQGTIIVPVGVDGTDGNYLGYVIQQAGLRNWYQKTGNCATGQTGLVNCNDDSQCDTSPGAGDGSCETYDISSGSYSGVANQISHFDVTSGVDAMYWHVTKPEDRGTIVMQGAQDSDGDCIPDEIEMATGTDPFNDDSDNDGLLDGEEDSNCDGVPDGTTGGGSSPESVDYKKGSNPRLFDTDGDGLSDGLELGLIKPHGIINHNPPDFVADVDPLTTTDPANPDTDGDKIDDGVEDANKNGRLDPGETSPLVLETKSKPSVFRKWSLSIHGGVSIPSGNFANDFKTGLNFNFDVDYHFSNHFSLIGLFGFNDIKSKTATIDDNYWINISTNLRYYRSLSLPWSIYFGGGPGIYIPENGDTEFGVNLGLGLNYELNSLINIELGADYHSIFNLDKQFFLIHLGILFRF